MTAKTDFLEDALLNHVLRHVPFTSPTTIYLALYTVAPSDAGGGTEVTGGSYARQSVTFSAPSGGSVANSGTITFPQATGSWGTIVAVALLDASTAGNMLYYGALAVSKTVGTGDQVSFAPGTLTASEA